MIICSYKNKNQSVNTQELKLVDKIHCDYTNVLRIKREDVYDEQVKR